MPIKEVYCKCGCGKRISHQKARRGRIFLNKIHANRYNGIKRIGTKNKKNFMDKGDFEMGNNFYKRYCKNFDNEKLTCLNCMDLAIFKVKSCYEEGEK